MNTLITEARLNFTLGDKIGNGGEGDVHKAHDIQLNAQLAVKKIPHAKFTNENLFFEECKKLYLSKHQNVVPVNYGCKDDEYVYLAMPLYEKGSLKNLIDGRFLTSREIIRYSLQFLSGLNHIHTKGLVHFDVKLENILISKSNQALITDFGVAQYTGHYGFASHNGTTRPFAPPEYFNQAEHNLKFDIYQAGLTIYRMCVGEEIFKKQYSVALLKRGVSNDAHLVEKIISGNFPNRSFHYSHIPKPLRTVITKAMNPDPEIRYSNVIDMMNDIAKIDAANDWNLTTDYLTFENYNKLDFKVTATKQDDSWNVVTTKNERRKIDFCDNNMTDHEKNSLLYNCLKKF